MSTDSLQQLADGLGRSRRVVQIAGLALTVGGFLLVRSMAPDKIQAQLAAGLAGVVLAVFTHYFHFLQRLNAAERRSLARAGLMSMAICLAASLGSAGYFLGDSPRTHEPAATAQSSEGSAEAAFVTGDDNTIEVQLTGSHAKRSWSGAMAKVLQVWTLRPDKGPKGPVRVPGTSDIVLDVRTSFPYTATSKLLHTSGGRVSITLKPRLPSKVAKEKTGEFDPTRMERPSTVTFHKGARDYVFLLELTLLEGNTDSHPLGKFLYMPDLGTHYGPVSGENLAVLWELHNIKAQTSGKLQQLLKANASRLR